MARAAGTGALGVALLLCGLTFDSSSLTVTGAALVALSTTAAAWVALAASGATGAREIGPRTVEEEEPYRLRLQFSAGLVPPPGGELVEPLLDEPIPLGLRRSRRARVDVRFGRRGRRMIEPASLVLRDPLWLATRERQIGERQELIVLPRIEPVLDAGGGSGRTATVEIGRALAAAASELELDTLRPYREGAPASRIHWPTVARTGELIERRLVAEADERPCVVLDTRRPESTEALDQAVRAAASLAVGLAHQGGCSLLLPGDRRPAQVEADLRTWPGLHVRLALAEEAAAPPSMARIQRAGTLFWVAAGTADRVPSGLERAAAATRYLVTPGVSPHGAPVFVVAGCTGVRLGRGRGRAAA